jgi:hypothetical protein
MRTAPVNRDELDKRNTAAITHWWVTMRDTGKVAPGLLDDLARIADEHALGAVVKEQVDTAFDTPPELRQAWDEISDAPPLVAASPESTGTQPTPSSVARTRTRTRRNTG